MYTIHYAMTIGVRDGNNELLNWQINLLLLYNDNEALCVKDTNIYSLVK